jgi:multidrug efflux system membrane fusion protein
VYLVNADQTVAVRPVTLGSVDGERVAVASGVAAGDVVVTEGGDRLRDGAPVQLPSAAPAPAASAAPAANAAKRPPGAHRRPRSNNAQ